MRYLVTHIAVAAAVLMPATVSSAKKPATHRYIGTFTSTSYGPPWGGINGGGVTAIGVNLRSGPKVFGVAADRYILRLGSRIRIWPNPFRYRGCFHVFDTGGAIRGRRLDFYDWRGRRYQFGWGRRVVKVHTCRRYR